MPRGASYIADLRLSRLTKLITKFMTPPSLMLTKMFGSSNAESDQIEWESQTGNRGMTPFVSPGAPAPQTAPVGVAKHSAAPAYWKEKIYYGEVFLNNLRKEGTESQYYGAKQRLARDMRMLRNRCDRRKEWMFAKMLTAGSFSYLENGGVKVSVDYGLLSDHQETLATDYKWESGSQRNPLEDIMDVKLTMSRSVGVNPDTALFNSKVLKYLALDPGIQTLLQKSAFGQGDLFNKRGGGIIGVNVGVLGSLLDIPNMVVYDEQHVVTAWITTNVTGGSSTVIYVDDATDFEAGQTLRFHDISANSYEDETISSVDTEAGTITVSSAPTASFKAGEDKVTMTKPYIPNDKFILFPSSIDGERIAEFMAAPFGLGRQWGMRTKRWDDNDPEGTWILVENKGLPILYHNDAVYILTVN